jgi:hypothetical protein
MTTTATAHTTDGGTTVIVHRRRMHVDLARWSTALLIAFMLLIPFTGGVDPTGAWIHTLNQWMFVVFIVYMSIQFWETANRSSTDRAGFFQDNGMALLGVIVGFIYLALLVTKALRMSQDQILLLLQCLGWGGLDFVFGVLISQRIAASAKEREEE